MDKSKIDKSKIDKSKMNKSKNMKKINKKKSLVYNRVNGGSYTNTKKINYTKKMSKNTNIDNSFSLFKKLNENEFVYKYYKKEDDDTMNKPLKNKRCMCINYQNINDFKIYDRCKRNTNKNTDFCELHQDCKSYLRNFLSGNEPEYKPEIWSDPYIEGSHNCYSYFLNRQIKAVKEKCNEICEKKHKNSCPKKDSECTDLKPQPGDFELIKRTGSDKDKERILMIENRLSKNNIFNKYV